MVQVEMVKTYFKYGNVVYWFLTPNWSPYGAKYDWWMGVPEETRLKLSTRIAPGRIVDDKFIEELNTMYERRLKLNKIITKIKNYEN